ncbi:MAG: DUF3105 domain-containing protein [Polyangiaceae bacterium]
MRRAFFAFFGCAFVAPSLIVVFSAGLSCGGSTRETSADAGKDVLSDQYLIDRVRLPNPINLGGPCDAVEDTPPLLPPNHVAFGTPVDYDSNPPSSGPHYPIWAAYQAYTTPVDRRYYVHDLEHGAVDLLYNCNVSADGGTEVIDADLVDSGDGDAGPCPAVAAQLQAIIDAFPSDPRCSASNGDPRVRFVLTPDPLLDVPVAAAAWGWTYKAQCVDPTTLTQFTKDHYDQGLEEICANGQSQF